MSHYFNSPTGPERRRSVEATIFGHVLRFQIADGVFASHGLDKATDLLLRTVPPPTGGGTVADLGCGWGPIAVGLAVANPKLRVDAVDVNERALQLTGDNAQANGVAHRVRTMTPEQGRNGYRQVWSNPPIRIGKAALHALLSDWLPRLNPDGEAFLVVGKNLGADSLQNWLNQQGWPTTRLASAKGFRVLRSTRS